MKGAGRTPTNRSRRPEHRTINCGAIDTSERDQVRLPIEYAIGGTADQEPAIRLLPICVRAVHPGFQVLMSFQWLAV